MDLSAAFDDPRLETLLGTQDAQSLHLSANKALFVAALPALIDSLPQTKASPVENPSQQGKSGRSQRRDTDAIDTVLWLQTQPDDLDDIKKTLDLLTTPADRALIGEYTVTTTSQLTKQSAPAFTPVALSCLWLVEAEPHTLNELIPTITRCRDLLSRHCVVVAKGSFDLSAYGFSRLSPFIYERQSQIQAWQFNLYDYKQKPAWLNAKYWANPENWGKYRW